MLMKFFAILKKELSTMRIVDLQDAFKQVEINVATLIQVSATNSPNLQLVQMRDSPHHPLPHRLAHRDIRGLQPRSSLHTQRRRRDQRQERTHIKRGKIWQRTTTDLHLLLKSRTTYHLRARLLMIGKTWADLDTRLRLEIEPLLMTTAIQDLPQMRVQIQTGETPALHHQVEGRDSHQIPLTETRLLLLKAHILLRESQPNLLHLHQDHNQLPQQDLKSQSIHYANLETIRLKNMMFDLIPVTAHHILHMGEKN